MTLEDCYEDKLDLINDLMDSVYSGLFEDIESDEEYSLSTDEINELVEDLIRIWVKKSIKPTRKIKNKILIKVLTRENSYLEKITLSHARELSEFPDRLENYLERTGCIIINNKSYTVEYI